MTLSRSTQWPLVRSQLPNVAASHPEAKKKKKKTPTYKKNPGSSPISPGPSRNKHTQARDGAERGNRPAETGWGRYERVHTVALGENPQISSTIPGLA